MKNVYQDADFLSAYKQKRGYLLTFAYVTIVYVLICLGLTVYRASLPYGSEYLVWPKTTVIILSILYVLTMFPFMSICFHRANRYYKMLASINEGLKLDERKYFYSFRSKTETQSNVDVIIGVFGDYDKRHQQWRAREVYFDVEKPLPDLNNGDLVHFVTQSNFFVRYEVLQRHAFDFSMAEDELPSVGLGVDNKASK